MTRRWKIISGIVAIGVAFAAWAQADWLAWDLGNQIPTASVSDSKSYRVFVRRLDVEPKEVDLAGQRYRIGDVWLEHLSKPRRISPFFTKQDIFPALVLCVDVGRADANSDAWIKDAKLEHIFMSGANCVKFTEVGEAVPKNFSLCTRDGRSEVLVRIKEGPDSERSASP